MTDIKPIETVYKGYRFRSRLEARWAVFFDHMDIVWQYEPEGFDLGNGMYYLPDFYFPELDLWAEVKGKMTEEDRAKIDAFRGIRYSSSDDGGVMLEELHRLIVLCEIPPEFRCSEAYFEWIRGEEFNIGYDDMYLPCVCPKCGRGGFEYYGRSERIHYYSCKRLGKYIGNKGTKFHVSTNEICEAFDDWAGWKYVRYDGEKAYSYDHPKVLSAFEAARQARFEHGESPDIRLRRRAVR